MGFRALEPTAGSPAASLVATRTLPHPHPLRDQFIIGARQIVLRPAPARPLLAFEVADDIGGHRHGRAPHPPSVVTDTTAAQSDHDATAPGPVGRGGAGACPICGT